MAENLASVLVLMFFSLHTEKTHKIRVTVETVMTQLYSVCPDDLLLPDRELEGEDSERASICAQMAPSSVNSVDGHPPIGLCT